MKCPACGYLSLVERERCPGCGLERLVLPRADTGSLRPEVLEPFADDENLPDVDADGPDALVEEEPAFTLGDDLIPPALSWGEGEEDPGREPADRHPGPPWEAAGFPGEAVRGGAVIDCEEQVPEQFWAPEGAGLPRRAAAALVDGFLCAAAVALFAAGAWVPLRLGGIEGAALFDEEVLRAVLLPFALLGLLVSFGYSAFFHGVWGATPGKRLTGLELRTVDGEGLSAGRVCLRWAGAVLGLSAVGAGVFWALFEARRRGWADLFSGTVVTERRGPSGGGESPGPGV